jgi:hypothetical protein
MTEAKAFVQNWSKVWRGRDSDAQLYMELLHEGCPLINPINPITREDLPAFVEAVLEAEPDIRVVPTRWAGTDDGSVLIEWVNTGTLHGAPLELRGADRYTLRDGKATEGHAYFDPRPFLDAQTAPTDPREIRKATRASVDLWPRYEPSSSAQTEKRLPWDTAIPPR